MGTYNPAMQKANFVGPRVEHETIGRILKRTAKLDGLSATLVTFGPGASVEEDAVHSGYFPAGVDKCPLSHVAYVLEGAIKIQQADGSEEIFRAGDVMLLPPDHLAWTVGEEKCVFVEFSRGAEDYYGETHHA